MAGEFPPLRERLRQETRKYVYEVMAHTNGNISKAAKLAGYHRGAFYRMCESLGIKL